MREGIDGGFGGYDVGLEWRASVVDCCADEDDAAACS
jgi:hypothetical protein